MGAWKLPGFTFTAGLLMQALCRLAVAQAFDPAQELSNKYGVQLSSSPIDSDWHNTLAGEDLSAQRAACPLAVGCLFHELAAYTL